MEITQHLLRVQAAVSIGALLLLWLLESWFPLLADRPERFRHAARNLGLGGLNLIVLGLGFSTAIAGVSAWAEAARFGLLNQLDAPVWLELPLALLLFDGWMYLWHRANHSVPLLWRFHRTHHADREVDVTTAMRFHTGEIVISTLLRLAVIPLFGLHVWQVIAYETLLVPVIAFHHSNVALPDAWDQRLRTILVSPNMHRVHHSNWQPETDSNFASVFSFWDRLWGTYRFRKDIRTLRFGLDGRNGARSSGSVNTSPPSPAPHSAPGTPG
jgi:sterol desaturase/sphingolipid hydroxylase (fatty acid hydroxylase superfamily)